MTDEDGYIPGTQIEDYDIMREQEYIAQLEKEK